MGFNRELALIVEGYCRGWETGYQNSFGPAYQRGVKLGLQQCRNELVAVVTELLAVRKLIPSEPLVARLTRCKDFTLLRRAVGLAATASSIDELTAALWPKPPTRGRKR
jgi:hypothetical protein